MLVSRKPEIVLFFSSFFLNFFWEVTQTYFYTLKDSTFETMLYAWLHCTSGDAMLTVGSFWLISLISWNRNWFLKLNKTNLAGFILVGVAYTLLSEWLNVHIYRSWVYNELMPIIPLIRVGLLPVVQWIVIPSVVILLVRQHLLLTQDHRSGRGREALQVLAADSHEAAPVSTGRAGRMHGDGQGANSAGHG